MSQVEHHAFYRVELFVPAGTIPCGMHNQFVMSASFVLAFCILRRSSASATSFLLRFALVEPFDLAQYLLDCTWLLGSFDPLPFFDFFLSRPSKLHVEVTLEA